MIEVVCGVVYNKGKVLIARRKQEKFLGGFWEFPGGKVEEGEEYVNTLGRELEEELGMYVHVKELLITSVHNYEKIQIQLIAYRCEFVSATFAMADHNIYEWVEPTHLLERRLAPADIPIALIVESMANPKD